MSAQTLIKVLLIDPQAIVLRGLEHLISSDKRYEVCGVANNRSEAIKLLSNSSPDVIVLDIEMGKEDGLELLDLLIKESRAKMMILTGSQNPELLDQAVVKGARGVINKSDPPETLLKAVEKIYLGELWLNQIATSRILSQISKAKTPIEKSSEQKKLETLTPKEEKVTRAIQLHSQKTLREIADALHISEHTLRNHLASIYDKIGVRNRMELYVFCGKYQKTTDLENHPRRRASDI